MSCSARVIALRVTALMVTVLLTACGGSKDSDEIVEGETVSGNPVGMYRQMAAAGNRMEKMQAELEEMEPVEPLNFSALLEYLPEPPAGWEADKARGSTSQMGEFSLTQVERNYTEGDKRMTVQIQDWAYNQGMYASFYMLAAFSEESTEGYDKGITIGDDAGREKYTHESKDGELGMLVAKRFYVSFDGSGIEAKELREWWDRFDVKGLRGAAK